MSSKLVTDLLMTSVGLIGMQSFLTWGAQYTIISHVNLYSSLCAIMIVAYRLVTCHTLTWIEIGGSLIAFTGCILTSFDKDASKTDSTQTNVTFGDFLSLLESAFETLYIIKGQHLARRLSPFQYLAVLSFTCCLAFFTVFPLLFTDSFYFTTDPSNGLFGWLSQSLYLLLMISFLNGIVTFALQFYVFQTFSPIIVGSMMLLEPIFG